MCSPRARSSVRSVSALDKTEKLRDTGKGKTRRPAPRRLVQLYAALLYNANLKGFIDGHIYSGDLKAACVPGLNCYSCPGAVAGCPLGALQNALGAAGHTAPWYVLGILALFGVILGRIVCGWLCPLGLIQELLHKIPTPKIRKSRFTRALSWLKYVFLAVFVLALPLYYGIANGMILPAFCKYICPAGTLDGDRPGLRFLLSLLLPFHLPAGSPLQLFQPLRPDRRQGESRPLRRLRPLRHELPDGCPACGGP